MVDCGGEIYTCTDTLVGVACTCTCSVWTLHHCGLLYFLYFLVTLIQVFERGRHEF